MRTGAHQPHLSIIIPAYNEEERLPDSLYKIAAFLRKQTYTTELIVVENGSSDDTSGVVEAFQAHEIRGDDPFTLELLHSAKGKGAAVQAGMLAGTGEYLFMCDADLSMPIEEISKFLPPALSISDYDIAIASREVAGAKRIDEPAYRHLMGRIYNFIVRVMAVPSIGDTQCGFKCFTREAARQLFLLQTIDGWGFDTEVLFIGLQKNMRLVEVPITWHYQANSRISPIRDSINMVLEMIRIRRNGLMGVYEDRG